MYEEAVNPESAKDSGRYLEIAPHIDLMVLFSGDGDFRSLVEAMQRRGVRVVVVSTVSTQPPMIAQELRRQADEFIDIISLQSEIGGGPGERPARALRDSRERRLQTAERAARSQVEAEEDELDD